MKMKKSLTLVLALFLCNHEVDSSRLPGPLVYIVTPSPRPLTIDQGRSAPFYYHNWMRRMDTPQNATSTTTTTKTPDLIFAEFESDNGDKMRKSIRKLLEKERVQSKSSTTFSPLYVPDEDTSVTKIVSYGVPVNKQDQEETKPSASENTDYVDTYKNLYGNIPAPVFLPPKVSTSTSTTTTTTTTAPPTTTAAPVKVENIWHIIDSEKQNYNSGNWEEVSVNSEKSHKDEDKKLKQEEEDNNMTGDVNLDENFALPGFVTDSGNGAENESRAIRTEPNIRFPYVNLKPFQMKNMKKPPVNTLGSSKKGNNLFTSLDNFQDIQHPVRGEAQDIGHMRPPIDRYNPAQPYLPPTDYGKAKQSSPSAPPSMKTVSNLVPPPPPPAPKLTADDFPAPVSYESFPPYPDSIQMQPAPPQAPPASQLPSSMFQPPKDSSDDSNDGPGDSSDDGPPMDLGYRYKPPSAPVPHFAPTISPLTKPYGGGYSYDKPAMTVDSPPPMDVDIKPDYHGYHYSKPEPPSPSHDHPSPSYDHQPPSYDYPPPSYGHHGPPSYHGDTDYPELIYDKPHGGGGGSMAGMDDSKDGKMKPDDMGMMPPPSPMKPDMGDSGPPMDDHGFPHDFPGDFKYGPDFDDHDFHHHHHHHTTTTTTTTEMPRVNRYSYYYLGKKLYYLPLYFSVYFIVYVGALIIKAVLRHKIVYPNSWRPNDQTASFFSKRSVDSWDSSVNLHELTGRVTAAIAKSAEKYLSKETKNE